MSMHPQPIDPVPAETARVARAAFRKGNLYLRLRDELGSLYADEQFADLFARRGHPALPPWRLALVCVFQYLEDLSDRQAADAVRGRIDWKYALGLELTDPGFDASVLCEFRTRLLTHQAEQLLFERFIQQLDQRGWIKKRGIQRTDSTHVLAAVRRLNRLELLAETLRAALNAVAEEEPAWLTSWVPPVWFERYSQRIEEWKLPGAKKSQEQWIETIGQDGVQLLEAAWSEQAPPLLQTLPAVEILRCMWLQQFFEDNGTLKLRDKEDLPPARLTIRSPYDQQAHYGHKRDLSWFGYKVHLSESCDEDFPHLITHVKTTDATETDIEHTEVIHQALDQMDRLPGMHLVDAGYVDAELLIISHDRYDLTLLGPVSRNNQWQAKAAQGYELASFQIDWQAKRATCPQGKQSVRWTERRDQHSHPKVAIRFGLHDCRDCPVRSCCTRSARSPRILGVRHQAEYEMLRQARLHEQTETFRKLYGRRSGIEGTHAQAVRRTGLRRTRYRGLAKTALQHVFTAVALNLLRIYAFLEGKKAAKTRISRFAALAPNVAT
jgi:transposase